MSIPDGWSKDVVWKKIWWIFKIPVKLPVAWIVEGTMSLQCCCPHCEYGEGYSDSFIYGQANKEVVKCDKCGTEFVGLVTFKSRKNKK